METTSEFGIIGASGHAKVILDLLLDRGCLVTAIIDSDPAKQTLLGHAVLTTIDDFDYSKRLWLIGIGNNRVRKQLAETLPAKFASVHSPHSHISRFASIGTGTVAMAGATINAHAVVGNHCIINTNASVDHDCTLHDYVHVSPNSAIAGHVCVGESSHIGIGASVIQGVKLGANVTVGAGSVVLEDIPDNATAVGVPAKVIKYS